MCARSLPARGGRDERPCRAAGAPARRIAAGDVRDFLLAYVACFVAVMAFIA
jgi:hypothetical protein